MCEAFTILHEDEELAQWIKENVTTIGKKCKSGKKVIAIGVCNSSIY